MSKKFSAKYYKKIRKDCKKELVKDVKIFLKNIEWEKMSFYNNYLKTNDVESSFDK